MSKLNSVLWWRIGDEGMLSFPLSEGVVALEEDVPLGVDAVAVDARSPPDVVLSDERSLESTVYGSVEVGDELRDPHGFGGEVAHLQPFLY